MSASMAEPKKKRRQNVACDACKLRRVKCDLSELLCAPAAHASASADTFSSLRDLVIANPDVGCSNCTNKGLRCTTNQIVNPAKPNKGGRRIDEARKRFGPVEDANGAGPSGTSGMDDFNGNEGSGMVDSLTAEDIEALLKDNVENGMTFDWSNMTPAPAPVAPTAAAVPDDWTSNGLPSAGDTAFMAPAPASDSQDIELPPPPWDPTPMTIDPRHSDNGQHFSQVDAPTEYGFTLDNPVPLSFIPQMSQPHTLPSRTQHSILPNASGAQPHVSFNADGTIAHAWRGLDTDAAPVWTQLANSGPLTSGAAAQIPSPPPHTTGPRFSSAYASPFDVHTPSSGDMSGMQADLDFDAGMMSFVARTKASSVSGAASGTPSPSTSVQRGLMRATPLSGGGTPISVYLAAGNPNVLVQARKRHHPDVESVHMDGSNVEPWKLWADQDQRIIRWGRREAVQQQLADRTLGGELSKHLVKTYFNCVHPSFPTLSPEGFYLEWERSGQQSALMTPAQEALCAVMEAWGARYSDSPVVLGLTSAKAKMAPKARWDTRAHWGKARLTVYNALAERARSTIDQNGILRTPSVTGLQALLLYNQLLGLTDQRSKAASQYVEGVMIHSSIIEQMKLLQLMWDSTGQIPLEDGEIQVTAAQLRMKQRRIFWTVLVSDAFNAMASGELPKIPDEELDSVAKWLSDVEAKLPLSTFKTLAFFISCYYRLSLVARFGARKITRPHKRPGTINVPEFCTNIRECWSQLKTLARDVTVITAELLLSCEHSLIGFSPMNYITNLRMSMPMLLLVLHQTIREQIQFRKNLKESYIFDDSPRTHGSHGQSESPSGPEDSDLAKLEQLHSQSVDILLHSLRSQMGMYKVILPTGMVQTAAVFLRVIIASAQFLAEVPTVEQGYPSNTLGGHGWTWETKQTEVKACIEALHQLGWAFADVQEVLESVSASMSRMTPSQEVLQAYHAKEQEYDERIVVAAEVAEENDQKLFDRAMTFWPPQSVPAVLETAMKNLRIDQSLDHESQEIPWDDLRMMRDSPQTGSTDAALIGHSPSNSENLDGAQAGPAAGLRASLAQMGKVEQDLATAAGGIFTNRDRIAADSSNDTWQAADSQANVPLGSWLMQGTGTNGWVADYTSRGGSPSAASEPPAKRQAIDASQSELPNGHYVHVQGAGIGETFGSADWTSSLGPPNNNGPASNAIDVNSWMSEFLSADPGSATLFDPAVDTSDLFSREPMPDSFEQLLKSFENAANASA